MRKVLLASFIALCIFLASLFIWERFFQEPLPRIDGARFLAIVAEGFDGDELESVTVIARRQGATVVIASFSKGRVVDYQGRSWFVNITFEEVDPLEFDAIIIPGGKGPLNIIRDPRAQLVYEIVRKAFKEGKVIAAICHGPWILAKADVVRGRRVVGHSDTVKDLRDAGAVIGTRLIEVDGNLITAQWEAMRDFGPTIVREVAKRRP